jgi:hypothetical protein
MIFHAGGLAHLSTCQLMKEIHNHAGRTQIQGWWATSKNLINVARIKPILRLHVQGGKRKT